MNLLEVFYDVTRALPDVEYTGDYDFWTIDDTGKFLYFERRDLGEVCDVHSGEEHGYFEPSDYFDFLDNVVYHDAVYVEFNNLKKYMEVEVEFETKPMFEGCQKYPLMCVRGECDKQCGDCKIEPYCFHSIPCTSGRPDWNCWTSKYPNFYDALFSVAQWIMVCKGVDALAVMFDFTPTDCQPELDFNNCTAFRIQGNKITIIKDAEKTYKEFNTKYPTQDRHIESSISDVLCGFDFHF